MNLRKLSLTKETIFADAGRPINQPISRAVAVAVVNNPFADRFVEDLCRYLQMGLSSASVSCVTLLASFRTRPSLTGKRQLSVSPARSSMERP
jgi:hypothetical protein